MAAVLRPTPAQRLAASPAVSAWVGANAGSGKTRVLTQRVARLLLDGAEPERILCITYTKAAAAEMQTRLFSTLGEWAMLPDEALADTLAALEEPPPPAAALSRARTLFAKALETPGGLRIQTIHAFCEALLRRFPLEAAVAPRFRVAEEREAALLASAIGARLGAAAESGADDAFDRVAERLADEGVAALGDAILARRADFPAEQAEAPLAAHFDPAALAAPEETARAALALFDLGAVAALAESFERAGGATERRAVPGLRAALAAAGDPQAALASLRGALLTKTGQPRSLRGFPSKAVQAADPGALPAAEALLAAAAESSALLRAHAAALRARDLNRFAAAWLGAFTRAKAARGLLDFDDLITRARDLLADPALAPWVLWKLDGGIDHILVDEAQDTAPAQWAVITAIAEEFFAGESARGPGRTLFVVGDEKQSIYSFQGADPRAFAASRAHFAARLEGLGQRLEAPALTTSFRSAPGILSFVDAVFAGEAARGLTQSGEPPEHAAHRAADPAIVDLWPALLPEPAGEEVPWTSPVDAPKPGRPKPALAQALAREIARMIAEDCRPARRGKPAAPVRPGDILVLVKTRDIFASTLIRALKAAGVPVAGADRMRLAEELAVQDLLAALRVAAMPQDDLSLAALLRSPLADVSEEGLFALAHGRAPGESLWQRVMAAEAAHPLAHALLTDLARQADYLRPYEMLERVLIRHRGRARLLARLGREAEEAIDELLDQALGFEAAQIPSLAGFVDWIARGDTQVKRQMEAGQDQVRVMTVHGAKGLEAPIVILPDTLGAPMAGGRGGRPVLLRAEGGDNAAPLMLWAGREGEDDPATAEARDRARRDAVAEHRRLLYVALTRAEDWLILAAAGNPDAGAEARDGESEARSEARDAVWYRMLRSAMERQPEARGIAAPPGLDGERLRLGPDPERQPAAAIAAAPAAIPAAAPGATPATAVLPGWAGPAAEEPRPRRIAPSDLLPHATAPAAPVSAAAGDPLAYGRAVHLLLERLSGLAPERRATLAPRLRLCDRSVALGRREAGFGGGEE
ncbi:MAG: double-strand break repair helicase AddA, partial [Pseudomonadota bacterium]